MIVESAAEAQQQQQAQARANGVKHKQRPQAHSFSKNDGSRGSPVFGSRRGSSAVGISVAMVEISALNSIWSMWEVGSGKRRGERRERRTEDGGDLTTSLAVKAYLTMQTQ